MEASHANPQLNLFRGPATKGFNALCKVEQKNALQPSPHPPQAIPRLGNTGFNLLCRLSRKTRFNLLRTHLRLFRGLAITGFNLLRRLSRKARFNLLAG